MFKKVGIIGLGLIGGSIAKALKYRCGISDIVAVNRNADVLKQAFNEGIINAYDTNISSVFKGCDIVFICTPVDKIFDFAEKLTNFVSRDCIVTDVGSTKNTIYNSMKKIEDKILFIGGHPMTGSEKFRYQASKEHLFENAYYIITPNENVPKDKVEAFKNLTISFGAIPVIISPNLHDYTVAAISHVPHIIAAALVNTVKALDNNENHMHLLAAGGFKDITRIASSNAEMWKSICIENKNEIINVLTEVENVIKSFKNSLSESYDKEIFNYFEAARNYRNSFSTITPGNFIKRYDINVDVLDKPGSIAIIAVLFSSNNINIKNIEILNNREHDNGALRIALENEEDRQKGISLLKNMNYEVYIHE